MVWDADSDIFSFSTKYKTVCEWKKACEVTNWTKRAVLKTTASTFDPLGLISPIIMYPRTIIQELWALDLDWDDKIPENISTKWEECLENILKVGVLKFYRWIGDCEDSNIELHIFCDASESAFATTVYSRVISRGENGKQVYTNLIMSKSRVSPLKNESVARLELIACVIGTRLLKAINTSYKIPQTNIYYYTDSRNSLCWINTPSHRAKTYVYNRTAEIQRVTNLAQWGHVPTDVNPADIATRFVTVEDLKENNIWFRGPPFLSDPEFKFSKYIAKQSDLTPEGLSELKPETASMVTVFYNFSIDTTDWYKIFNRLSVGKQYNTFRRFKQALILIFKYLHKKQTYQVLSPEEKVDIFIHKISQQNSFPEEIRILLRKGKLLPNKHLFAKYNPYIDKHGVVRSNSRLDNLDFLPEETRRPVILLGTDPITKLIASEIHWQVEHAVSQNLVRSTLHKKYIIIGLTRLVKSLSSNCIICQKLHGQPCEQIMGNLKIRTGAPQRPFAETGIDFAGPFETVQGRGTRRKQHFVLVLTCLQTRAVHFEPTQDQTTNSVIKALIRFSAYRGRPKYIVSDNQTSFKAADKDLRDYFELFKANINFIERGFNKQDEPVQWVFIPPRAPHLGGSWEIMVKAMKRALNSISQGQPMTEDDFHTFLCQAMNLINNRPLLKHYTQETSYIITPNSFQVGKLETGLVPPLDNIPETKLGAKWRQIETLTNQLWHKFIHEILPELAPRQKWKKHFNDLKEGDIVLVIETGLPRGVWKVGRVVEIFLSRDGFTREALVQIGNKCYERSITKLIPLLSE